MPSRIEAFVTYLETTGLRGDDEITMTAGGLGTEAKLDVFLSELKNYGKATDD